MGFYKQGILEWLVISPPGNLPDSGIKPRSPALQAGSSITSDRDAFPLLVQERHFPHGIFISYFQEDKGWSACVFCTHCFSSNFHFGWKLPEKQWVKTAYFGVVQSASLCPQHLISYHPALPSARLLSNKFSKNSPYPWCFLFGDLLATDPHIAPWLFNTHLTSLYLGWSTNLYWGRSSPIITVPE